MTRTRLEPRTEPQQQRSRDRVREILDATEALVLEVGYDGINTNLIAQRAAMPVGTLYRYYSDKYGVFAAVAQRAFVDLETRWQELGQPDPDRTTIEDYFDGIVDMMASFWMDRKSAMLLWGVLRRTPEMQTVSDDFDSIVATRNAETLGRYYPSLGQKQRLAMGLVIEETGTAVLNKMVAMKTSDRRELIKETKRLIRAYVVSLAHEAKQHDDQ
jgi:AcrR family transcriptional regulator